MIEFKESEKDNATFDIIRNGKRIGWLNEHVIGINPKYRKMPYSEAVLISEKVKQLRTVKP